MVWLTSIGANCGKGFAESCCIFLFDSTKMRQSLVRWSVLLPWYMQYKGLFVYGPRP
jgi:hypothetical protein